eukprot:4030569-Pleurochrysis_carterae.AAC.1
MKRRELQEQAKRRTWKLVANQSKERPGRKGHGQGAGSPRQYSKSTKRLAESRAGETSGMGEGRTRWDR